VYTGIHWGSQTCGTGIPAQYCVLCCHNRSQPTQGVWDILKGAPLPACEYTALSVPLTSGEHSGKLNVLRKKVSFEFIFLTILRSIFSFE
jgi:hypothetical protein